MIAILGESASGKSTLCNDVLQAKNNVLQPKNAFKKVILYTTRPMRANEADGVDYHFVSPEDFHEYKAEGLFYATSDYRGWKYAITRQDVRERYGLAVLTPKWLRLLKSSGISVFSIYIYVDRESRLIKAIQRGDDIDEAYRRNLSEVGQYDGIENEVDYVLNNAWYNLNPQACLNAVKEVLEDQLW